MSEKIRNFENNSKDMRGFYVTKMKKDQATGHYFRVATWIPRNVPLPGSRTNHSSRWSVTRESSVLSSLLHDSENFVSSREENAHPEQGYHSATSDDFSRLAKQERTKPTDAIGKKSSFYDPYDSYEL